MNRPLVLPSNPTPPDPGRYPHAPFPSLSLPAGSAARPEAPLRRWAVPYVLPGAVLTLAVAALLWHGPIAQPAGYHDFADTRALLGLANAADVLSNLGFAAVGLLGLATLRRHWRAPALAAGRDGWLVFFAALMLTAIGSAAYHLAPDNARLVWDRLPIALACAGLLAAAWRETIGAGRWVTPALVLAALCATAWWRITDLQGSGDLRPYLLLQGLPLVLLPLLQWQHEVPLAERLATGGAMLLYVLAKGFEWADRAVFAALGVASGHTIKHLLATLAAALIGWALAHRLGRAGRRTGAPLARGNTGEQ